MTAGYEDHPLLPADALHGQAHILASDAIPVYGRILGDYIATFLMKLDKYPDALKDFFDPNIKFFHLVRKFKKGMFDAAMEFMISRKEDRVIVGWFEVDQNGVGITWECVTETKLSKVGPDAKWNTTWGAHIAYSVMPIESIWEQTFLRPNQPGFERSDPHNPRDADQVADFFGEPFYNRCAWEGDKKSDFILTKN